MPKIPIYENQDVALRPSDRGTTAAVNTARRVARASDEGASGLERVASGTRSVGSDIERLGSQIGAEGQRFANNLGEGVAAVGKVALDYWTHREVSTGAAKYAEVNDGLTNAWNERVRSADPNDPAVAAKFREEVLTPTLEKFNQGFMTEGARDWAERRTEAMRNHFFEKTSADMMTLAGAAVSNNMHEMSNRMSNTAMSDPSSVPHLLGAMKSSVDAMIDSSPNLKGVTAAKAKLEILQKTQEGIVKAGAIGAMQDSPNPEATAAAWAEKYPQFLNGADVKALAKAAAQQVKFNNAQDKAAKVQEKQLQQMEFDRAGSSLVTSLIRPDGTVAPATPEYFKQLRDVARMPGSTEAKTLSLFNFGLSERVKAETSDEPTVTGLQTKLLAGELTPNDLVAANVAKKITDKDFSKLEAQRKLIEERPLNDKTFTAASNAAKASLFLPTAYSDFLQEFLPLYIKKKADGSLEPNALDMRDPNSMISRMMAPHMPSTAEKFQYQILKNAGIGVDPDKLVNAIPTVPRPDLDGIPVNLRPFAGKGLERKGDMFRYNGKNYDKAGQELK